jgi:hypothetical protein
MAGDETAEDAEERAFLEHLRANGVRVGRQSLDRPRVIAMPRPWWLALFIRVITRFGYNDEHADGGG